MSRTEPKRVVVALGPEVDPAVSNVLQDLKGVEVIDDYADGSRLLVDDSFIPLDVQVIGASDLTELLAGGVADDDRRRKLVVVEALLDEATRGRLEDAGIAYVDGARQAWFPSLARTARARQTPGGKPWLRSASLGAAQLLADHPEHSWTQRSLAERAETTAVTTHRLFGELTSENLIELQGSGRSSHRRVSDIAGLRRWLAARARPTAKTRTLSFFVRDPDSLPSTLPDGRKLVLSGGHAAAQHGLPVMTHLPPPLYRVDADGDRFEAIPAELGGFRTDAGANVLLVADPGRLALIDARPTASGGWIAPPSRTMLDLYLEARGDAAVNVFLDLWGDRAI